MVKKILLILLVLIPTLVFSQGARPLPIDRLMQLNAGMSVGPNGAVQDSVDFDADTMFVYSGGVEYKFVVNGGGTGLPSGTEGDIIYFNGSNWVTLPAGTTNQFLKSGTTPSWDTPSGSGDMLVEDSVGGSTGNDYYVPTTTINNTLNPVDSFLLIRDTNTVVATKYDITQISTGGGSLTTQLRFVVGNTVNAPTAGTDTVTNSGFFGTHLVVKRDSAKYPGLFEEYETSITNDSTLNVSYNWVQGERVVIESTLESAWVTGVLSDTSSTTPTGIIISHSYFENTLNDTLGDYDGSVVGTNVAYDNIIAEFDNYYVSNNADNKGIEYPSYEFGNTFTISCWIYTRGDVSDEKAIFTTLQSSDGFEIGLIEGVSPSSNPDSLYVITSNGVASDTLYSTSQAWSGSTAINVVVTVDRLGGDCKIYAQGADITGVGNILTDFNTESTARSLLDFADAKSTIRKIEDLQIYNVILTPTEALFIYNNIGEVVTR